MLVIAKECLPALALIMVRLSLWQISRDCGESDRDPKLREFSPDLSGADSLSTERESLMNPGQTDNDNRQPYTEFLGCSRFPRCRYTEQIEEIPASSH
jgi:ssDNA-binding Zn-finger/Zn-ribbon topoisomerase 1